MAELHREAKPKHVDRAKEAIARTLCECHFTDGFCMPRHRPDCRCVELASASLAAMATVGVIPVWVHDKDTTDV